MDGQPGSARPVVIELVRFALTGGQELSYQVGRDDLPASAAPDDHALALSGVGPGEPGGVCHSTSWRYDTGVVVLTYAATPLRLVGASQPLVEPAVVCSDDPLRPTPPALHAHHVVAHAARHLAYLARHDPTVAATAQVRPQLWAALQQAADRMPVAPHARAHSLATRPAARVRSA